MTHLERSRFGFAAALSALALALTPACKNEQTSTVPDADIPQVTPDVPEAGPVDISQCAGCQLAAQPAWTFEGIFADAACTQPLAQLVASACAVVPSVGPANVTYVDEIGGRKAGEAASVTLTAQVGPETARYRKTAKGCVKANEAAVDITPMGCAGSRVCRDDSGVLVCTGCRTFANGCPDFEETRMYASIEDPKIKGATGGGGGGDLAKLRQCCAAIAAEAKRLGSSPEAGMLATAAAQCNAMAAGGGTAPELSAIRGMLAGRPLPAVCAGL